MLVRGLAISLPSMADEKQELRIVAGKPSAEESPPGLRLLKTIKTPRNDTYLVFAPDIAQKGLHLSMHPSGEIHLKSTDRGVIARVKLTDLVQAFQTGAIDAALASVLSPPDPTRRAEGVVVRPEGVPKIAAPNGPPTLSISVEELLESITPIEILDMTRLAEHIDWLRKSGHLPAKGLLMLKNEGSDDSYVFVNAYDELPKLQGKIELPPGVPMPKTLRKVVDQLQTYGGFFVTLPDDPERLAALALKAGLGDVYAELSTLFDDVKESDMQQFSQDFIKQLGVLAASTLAQTLDQRTLRPGTEQPK